jgi:bifunctional non-homologous end joining protein LigD
MGLTEYRRKRHFTKTAEPAGKAVHAKRKGKALSFVIQKHAATRLHFDFRLELDGVLKSWAVPKGPSLDATDKRLAVQVEDHPLEYAKFEGTIPEGEYGAGEVIVWDRGTWEPDGDPHRGLAAGKLDFELHGERLSGAWKLLQLRGREGGKNWLLVKRSDDAAHAADEFDVTAEYPESLVTGRTLDDIAHGVNRKKAGRKVRSARTAKKTRTVKKSGGKRIARSSSSKSKEDGSPAFITPQLATLTDKVPTAANWIYELKYDGYRLLASSKAMDTQRARLDGSVQECRHGSRKSSSCFGCSGRRDCRARRKRNHRLSGAAKLSARNRIAAARLLRL